MVSRIDQFSRTYVGQAFLFQGGFSDAISYCLFWSWLARCCRFDSSEALSRRNMRRACGLGPWKSWRTSHPVEEQSVLSRS